MVPQPERGRKPSLICRTLVDLGVVRLVNCGPHKALIRAEAYQRSSADPFMRIMRRTSRCLGVGWPAVLLDERAHEAESPPAWTAACRPTRCRPQWTARPAGRRPPRSEEHTSELQSRPHLVCRLLLEKKNKTARLPFLYKNKKNN